MNAEEFEGLQCAQCGGIMQVRFVGELRDKQAICPYCGATADLPDSFRRVQREREHERHPWGEKTVESVLVEMRSDCVPDGERPESSPGLDEILEVLREMGLDAPGDEVVQKLEEGGLLVRHDNETLVSSPTFTRREQGLLTNALESLGLHVLGGAQGTVEVRMSSERSGGTASRDPLDPETVLRMAGGPMPLDERRNCPKCDAVVSRNAKKCPWCSASL